MGLGKINPDEARCWPVSLSTSPAIVSSRQFRALASQKNFLTKWSLANQRIIIKLANQMIVWNFQIKTTLVLTLATTLQSLQRRWVFKGGEENGLQTILECTNNAKVKAVARKNVPRALSVSWWCDEGLQRLGRERPRARLCCVYTSRHYATRYRQRHYILKCLR